MLRSGEDATDVMLMSTMMMAMDRTLEMCYLALWEDSQDRMNIW